MGLQVAFLFHNWAMRFKETIRFCVIKITMRFKKMALRLHIDKNIGDAFITFYVAFIRKKLALRL